MLMPLQFISLYNVQQFELINNSIPAPGRRFRRCFRRCFSKWAALRRQAQMLRALKQKTTEIDCVIAML